MLKAILRFIASSKRILQISQKPTSKEYWTLTKIIGLGMLILGVIGYIIRLIIYLV